MKIGQYAECTDKKTHFSVSLELSGSNDICTLFSRKVVLIFPSFNIFTCILPFRRPTTKYIYPQITDYRQKIFFRAFIILPFLQPKIVLPLMQPKLTLPLLQPHCGS